MSKTRTRRTARECQDKLYKFCRWYATHALATTIVPVNPGGISQAITLLPSARSTHLDFWIEWNDWIRREALVNVV